MASPDTDRRSHGEAGTSNRPQSAAAGSAPRAFANPLLAEAAKIARERQMKQEQQQNRHSTDQASPSAAAAAQPKRGRSRWLDDEDAPNNDDGTAAGASGVLKRKHSPIIWNANGEQEKYQRTDGGVQRPRSAAEIAQAEVQAFRQLHASDGGLGNSLHGNGGNVHSPIMKSSPDISSPEEEAHIRREGNSVHEFAELHDDDNIASPLPQPADNEEQDVEKRSIDNEPRSEDELSPPVKLQISMLNECRSVENYEKLNRISEGTYGVVYRARDRETGRICALKKVKLEKERDGFPLTSVREINVLLSLAHPNIVNVSEVVVGSSMDSVFMVMEYADHDLKSVMEQRLTQPFSTAEVKCLMRQLLSGVAYLHENWVLHRDLKTSNILYTNRGVLKICDFGLARQYGSPLKPYTHLVVTLWYRAPELLLGALSYSTAIDVWSCGCIMAELLTKQPLFAGKQELNQIELIFKTMGTPTPQTWPGIENLPTFRRFKFKGSPHSVLRQKFPPPGPVFDGRPSLSEAGFDLLSGLLELCPEHRLTAQEALDHPWFREQPLPKDTALMPTFPGTNEALHGHGGR